MIESRYLDMLSDDTSKKTEQPKLNDHVLLVDSLNTFIRSFAVIKHLNPNLVPIGGLTGYLRSLGYAINLVRPTRVIIVFDGKGGSTNKKYLYPEYKANRGLTRITNWDMFESHEEETDALRNQLIRLVDYLRCLPVDMVTIDKIEADDVIGHLVNKFDKNITIMSSDKDYLQLVSHRVTVYSPTKKIFYTPKTVFDEYGITPQNFLLHKILLGDGGDNVPGVKGLGLKTLIKNFPELSKEYKFTLEEVLEKCETGKSKIHQNILNFKHQLPINKLLMDLHDPNIPEPDVETIQTMIDSPNKRFDHSEFMKLYDEDLLGKSIQNLQTWLFNHFYELSKYK